MASGSINGCQVATYQDHVDLPETPRTLGMPPGAGGWGRPLVGATRLVTDWVQQRGRWPHWDGLRSWASCRRCESGRTSGLQNACAVVLVVRRSKAAYPVSCSTYTRHSAG